MHKVWRFAGTGPSLLRERCEAGRGYVFPFSRSWDEIRIARFPYTLGISSLGLAGGADFVRRIPALYEGVQSGVLNYTVFRGFIEGVWDKRNLRLARLLQSWLDDDSGYDEGIWPLLDEELKKEGGVRLGEDEG